MKVRWQDLETGEDLPVVIAPAAPGIEVAAPAFIHTAGAWADQLRVMWAMKHYDPNISYDHPTLYQLCPAVVHGEHEMLCGDQRFYEVPE